MVVVVVLSLLGAGRRRGLHPFEDGNTITTTTITAMKSDDWTLIPQACKRGFGEKKKKKRMLNIRNDGDDKSTVKVHLIPFTVECDEVEGEPQHARVSSYFRVVAGNEGHCRASFRGREVKGVVARVPEGYVGAIVRVDSLRKEEGERRGKLEATFREITVWDHDFHPMETDNFFEWLKWPALASAIHAEVEGKSIDERNEKMPNL